MINWCPQCRTVISDLETEEREVAGHLWHIRYPAQEGGLQVVVATTRPETMLGDTGVAVHPNDDRWREAIGRQVELPLMDRAIPIVADEYADPELGSGAVKVTPAHDPNDYELGLRHDLAQIQVIGFDGVMTEAGWPLCRIGSLRGPRGRGGRVGSRGAARKNRGSRTRRTSPRQVRHGRRTPADGAVVYEHEGDRGQGAARARAAGYSIRARPLPPLCDRVVGSNTRLGFVAADLVGASHSRLVLHPLQCRWAERHGRLGLGAGSARGQLQGFGGGWGQARG